MIFISAQPDEYYFLWQLEIQLYNFSSLGIPRGDIHVLIGYDPQKGLSHDFKEFIAGNKWASFYTYPDTRVKKGYLSSIRPNLIKQHLKAHPKIDSVLFYHDSDILLREVPDFASLSYGSTWHVSDTRSYLDSNYIKTRTSESFFSAMCSIVGIESSRVIANDVNIGGAQYLIKNSTNDFWEKVERDSEALYKLLKENASKQADEAGVRKSEYKGIDIWCADMWALAWNALYFDFPLKISRELDFCWPFNPIREWSRTKILHYAGVSRSDRTQFYKGDYIHFSPLNVDLSHIDDRCCSLIIKNFIEGYRTVKNQKRSKMPDTIFFLHTSDDSTGQLEILKAHLSFIETFLDVAIVITGPWNASVIKHDSFLKKYRYISLGEGGGVARRSILSVLKKSNIQDIVGVIDVSVIIPIKQIIKSVALLRKCIEYTVVPYRKQILGVDTLFKMIFFKTLDPMVFEYNRGKFNPLKKGMIATPFFMKTDRFRAELSNVNSGSKSAINFGLDSILETSKIHIPGYGYSLKKNMPR